MTQVFDSRIQQSEQSVLRSEEEMIRFLEYLFMQIKDTIGDLLKFFKEGEKEKKANRLRDIGDRLQSIEESIKDNGKIPPKMRQNIAKLREQVNKCQKQLADGKDIPKSEVKQAEMLVADVTRDLYNLHNELQHEKKKIATTSKTNENQFQLDENQFQLDERVVEQTGGEVTGNNVLEVGANTIEEVGGNAGNAASTVGEVAGKVAENVLEIGENVLGG